MLTSDLMGPLDDLAGLDQDQLENLRGWEERFLEKYLVVGKLVAEGDYQEEIQKEKEEKKQA